MRVPPLLKRGRTWKNSWRVVSSMAQSIILVLMPPILNVGKVKSIGVSNFSIKTLDVLLPQCTVVPVTNQVEMHPCLPQHDLKQYCESKGIILTAYSPLGLQYTGSRMSF